MSGDLHGEIRGLLIEEAFWPLDGATADEDHGITERDASVLRYFEERGWEAARLEGTDERWATLVRWTDAEVHLMVIDRNGVAADEARLTLSATALVWLAALLAA